ncbi:MAG: N-acetyltransferase [Lentisphaeria bacterium]|nr:N-acetyltransferase [Lentisphaeria bacterium]
MKDDPTPAHRPAPDETPVLRELRDADVGAATALYNHYVRYSTATFQVREVNTVEFRAQFLVADTPLRLLAAEANGKLVGFGGVLPYHTRCAYRHTGSLCIYLKPSATGRGYGASILAAAEAQARSAGLHALLAAICAENRPSLTLFQRHGYTQAGHLREVGHKFGRWLDVILLEKLL